MRANWRWAGAVGRSSRMAVLAMIVVAGALALASDVQAGKPAPAPKLFEVSYSWGGPPPGGDWSQVPTAIITLYNDHTIDVDDGGTTTTDAGTWSTTKGGKTITFNLDGGAVYTGTRQADGTYAGTMTAPGVYGGGVWIGEYL